MLLAESQKGVSIGDDEEEEAEESGRSESRNDEEK